MVGSFHEHRQEPWEVRPSGRAAEDRGNREKSREMIGPGISPPLECRAPQENQSQTDISSHQVTQSTLD